MMLKFRENAVKFFRKKKEDIERRKLGLSVLNQETV